MELTEAEMRSIGPKELAVHGRHVAIVGTPAATLFSAARTLLLACNGQPVEVVAARTVQAEAVLEAATRASGYRGTWNGGWAFPGS